MKKKIFRILFCCILMTAFLPVYAFANGENAEAQIGSVEFNTLEEAIDAASGEDVVYLLKNLIREGVDPINISKNITLDFNGHSITVDKSMFEIGLLSTLTLENAEVYQTSEDYDYGFITNCYGSVVVNSTTDNGINTKSAFIKNANDGSDIEFSGGVFNSDYQIVGSSGKDTTIRVNAGQFTAKSGEGMFAIGDAFCNIAGNLYIEGGSITGEDSCVSLIDGAQCEIGGESFFTSYSDTLRVEEGARLTIGGGKVVTTHGACVSVCGGTVIIDDGTFMSEDGTGIYVFRDGELTVNESESGPVINAVDSALRIDSGIAVINGGIFTSNGTFEDTPCMDVKGGELNITKGKFCGRDEALYLGNGTCVISGGTFESPENAAYISDGELTINAGVFHSTEKGNSLLIKGGNIVVNSGTYTADNGYGIWNSKNSPEEGANLTINNCISTGKDAALYLENTTHNTISGGTYTNANASEGALKVWGEAEATVSYGIFTNSAGGTAISDESNKLTIAEGSSADPEDWRTINPSVVKITFPVARIGDTEYASLEEAFEAAQDHETIVMLKNVVNYDKAPIAVNKKVTLDFNGCNITVNDNMFTVNKNAGLILKNADVQQLKEGIHAEDYAFIRDCFGNVTVESTSEKNININHAFISTLYSAGSFVMNGGTIDSKYLVIKNAEKGSIITVNDGQLIGSNGLEGDDATGNVFSSVKGKLEMNGGELHSGLSGIEMYEEASTTINGGLIESYSAHGIGLRDNSNLVINDVVLDTKQYCISADRANVTIYDGVFTAEEGAAVGLINSTNADIYGGDYQSHFRCVEALGSNVTIQDGVYTLTDPMTDFECPCIYLERSTAYIKDGVFDSQRTSTIIARGSELTIDGGTIKAGYTGIEIEGSQVVINDGTVLCGDRADCVFIVMQDPENPREFTDTVTINGGKFTTEDHGHCVWNKYGHVIINDGTFESGEACVYLEVGENAITGGEFTSHNDDPAVKVYGDDLSLTLSGGKFVNKSGKAALVDNENMKIAEGYKADPENWKETGASVVEIIPEKGPVVIEYDITRGAGSTWNEGSKEGLVFCVNADFSKFTGVEVDGKAIDKTAYKAWEGSAGSTCVELQPIFLKNLSAGKHTIKVLFKDGYAETSFSVVPQKSVNTGDASQTALWIILFVVAGASIVTFNRKFAKR